MDAMMDMNDIRESGLLERYILGEVTKSEQLQVEALLEKDSLLRSYFDQLESDFERIAQENAIVPPTSVKKELMQEISRSNPVITKKADTGLKSYLVIAASLALLFGLSAFWMYSKLGSVEEELRLVQDKNEKLQDVSEEMLSEFKLLEESYKQINSPSTLKLILKGNEKAPNATAISYVNHQEKMVLINAEGLPILDKDKDYQMWADVAGEMIDMGVIKKGEMMLAMTYIENAESLNITIEPAGGNDHPTVENLISNVYLN